MATTEERIDKSPQDAQEIASKTDRKQLIAQVLKRGLVNHRLDEGERESDRVYVWVRETDEDIMKFKSLYYRIESGPSEGNRRRIADSILMSVDRDTYELIQEVRREQTARLTGDARALVPEDIGLADVPILEGK
jgi:hypothetical protein